MKPFLLCAAVLLAACSKAPEPASAPAREPAAAPAAANRVTLDAAAQKASGVAIEVAAQRALPETIRASARITNDENQTWRVGAVTDGRVIRVLAAPGDFVKAGQPLARIHGHDVHDSRALYRNAQTELMRATANVQYSAKARDRARRLYDMKAGSLEQLEHAEAELRNSEASLATARVEVERTRLHLVEFLGVPEGGGHDHQPGAESDDADLIPIRSPAAGVVIARNITPGAVVTPSTDLFVLTNLSSVWAIAEVNEESLPKLAPGMPVRVSVQAWPGQSFPGRIGRLGEALDPSTRTVKVRVDLPNRAGRLKPEMYATAEIQVGASQPAVFVPEQAVQEVRGQKVVFVQTAPSAFEVRPVDTGQSLDGAVEITRGLRSGERVAAHGAFVLKSEYLKAALSGE
ncbi:MAG: efflux RND transporter periplasmic adaptor subunit [Acidobacteria bacterium]|nr:efflux RND transporter periplasmic adaptor subunit [Acidobacteriota bacterium]